MHRFLQVALVVVAATGATGCFYNQYSSDPIRRYQQLYYQSQDLKQLEDDWERLWQLDSPSQLSPYRYNGFAYPGSEARRYRLSQNDRGGFETRFLK